MLYALLGAPPMFLANGISYLFSAATELFIRVPKVERAGAPPQFFADLKAGFRYVWQSGGLRSLLLVAAVLNFFAMVGIVLILPNVLIQSLIQLSTPQEMRGMVMGLLEALTGGLVPIGIALGGLLRACRCAL